MLAGDSNSIVHDLDGDSPRLVRILGRALIFGDHLDHAALGQGGVGGVEKQIEQDLMGWTAPY